MMPVEPTINLVINDFFQIFHRLKSQSDAVGDALGGPGGTAADDADCHKIRRIHDDDLGAAAAAAASSSPEECCICLERG
jgi:hypothetical protein